MRQVVLATTCLLIALVPLTLLAEMPYFGPKPEKEDHPYLMLGNRIVETEEREAGQNEDKKRIVYTVSGTSSPVRSPLAEPAFLFKPGSIRAEALQLYPMKIEKGNRSITFHTKPKKDDPRPVPLMYHSRKDGSVIIETNQYLENGEYCLSPEGVNTVFCFQVY
jgi:hypothetical protein